MKRTLTILSVALVALMLSSCVESSKKYQALQKENESLMAQNASIQKDFETTMGIINEVENNLLHHSINCYADIELYFENPEKYGYEYSDITWGDFITIDEYDEEKDYYQSQLNELLTIDYESLQGDDRRSGFNNNYFV